jgi:hypothetical protein
MNRNTTKFPLLISHNGIIQNQSVYVFQKGGVIPNLFIDFTTTSIGVDAVITNNGIADASGVAWQIHEEGGLLGFIDTTVDGTIDIPIGESRKVSTDLFLGLGPFTVTARADDAEKTGAGLILLFYILEVT